MKELVRIVQTRVEDLQLLWKATEPSAAAKLKGKRLEVFDELKNSEISRLFRENNLYQALLGMKQTSSNMTRRQLIKHCSRIGRVFWNVIEAENEVQDLAQMK